MNERRNRNLSALNYITSDRAFMQQALEFLQQDGMYASRTNRKWQHKPPEKTRK